MKRQLILLAFVALSGGCVAVKSGATSNESMKAPVEKATTEVEKAAVLSEDGTQHSEVVAEETLPTEPQVKAEEKLPTEPHVEAEETLPPDPQGLACDDLIQTGTDRVSGRTIMASAHPLLVKGADHNTGVMLGLVRGMSDSIILDVRAVGASPCIDKGGVINVLFRDGTRMELKNDGDFSCEGSTVVYFRGTFGKATELKALSEKPIEIVRVWTMKSYVEVNLSTEESESFMQTLRCISK